MDLSRLPPALPAFAAYLAAALLLGECYPLSRYPMYAQRGYDQGSALVFLADGQPVTDLRRYHAFADFDPEDLRFPPHHGSGAEYLLDAVRHEVATRSRVPPPDDPSVDLQIGYAVARATPDGPQIVEPFVPLARGRAWSSD